MSHRTPSFVELSSGSFQSIMNAPQEPLVLIAAVTEKVRDQAMVALKTLANEWKLKTGGSGELNGKQVIFTYMDAEKRPPKQLKLEELPGGVLVHRT